MVNKKETWVKTAGVMVTALGVLINAAFIFTSQGYWDRFSSNKFEWVILVICGVAVGVFVARFKRGERIEGLTPRDEREQHLELVATEAGYWAMFGIILMVTAWNIDKGYWPEHWILFACLPLWIKFGLYQYLRR